MHLTRGPRRGYALASHLHVGAHTARITGITVALELVNLKKDYAAPDGSVVSVIDLEHLAIADGEQVALIGTSGSGKTTSFT